MSVHFGAQAVFLACGLIMLGLIFMVIGVLGTRPGRSSLKWPAVNGQIIASETAFDPLSGRMQARVRYHYIVDEKAYTGSRIRFNESHLFFALNAEPAETEVQRYPVGQALPVYYDPADPARSVLIPGSGTQSMLPIGIGGLFFVIGLIAGLFSFL